MPNVCGIGGCLNDEDEDIRRVGRAPCAAALPLLIGLEIIGGVDNVSITAPCRSWESSKGEERSEGCLKGFAGSLLVAGEPPGDGLADT